jgi:hypothetical protein
LRVASRSGCSKGRERSSKALSTLNTPVVAPIDTASTPIVNAVCTGRRFHSRRQ